MKTNIKQFKKAAAGILSIAVLSSAMVITTVSTSSAKQIGYVDDMTLAGMCKRSGGHWNNRDHYRHYGCEVNRADGTIVDVSCDSVKKECHGTIFKKNKRGGRAIKVDLHQQVQNAEQLIAPTTPKKPSYLGKKLKKN